MLSHMLTKITTITKITDIDGRHTVAKSQADDKK